MIDYRILGPLQVLDDGRPVPLGTAKQQALLAVLLLHANEIVARERLIDELWGAQPPPTAVKAVQVYVSQLRKRLPRNGSAIGTRANGYVLELAPDELDASRFERAVAEARGRAAAGATEQATNLFEQALALWRGRALAGLSFESYASSDVERLEELRLAALIDRIDCELALSRHDRVIGELEQLVVEHPLKEQLHGQLMLALYRSGRQAEALRAYRQARETLVEQFGIEPSAPLQRLEHAILLQDDTLEAPNGDARTREPMAPPPQLEQVILGQDEALRAPRSTLARSVPKRLSRRAAVALGGALVLVAASAAAIVQRHGGQAGLPALAVNSVGQIDPDTGRIEAQLTVGRVPGALAVGDRAVWVANRSEQSISRIDTTSREVRAIPISGQPSDIAVGGGAVWVVHVPAPQSSGTAVSRVDPEAALELRTIRLPGERNSIGYARGSVWVGSPVPRASLAQLDPARNALARQIEVGPARGFASGYGALWVTTTAGVARIDPGSGTVTSTINLTRIPQPTGIATGEGAVWIASASPCCAPELRGAGILWRIDPARNEVTASATLAQELVGDVAVGEGAVWVADPLRRVVLRVDPRTLRVTKTIRIGNRPASIAVGAGSVWVSVN